MSESLGVHVRRQLDQIARSHLTRTLRPPVGVDLCSNDYLGLSCHPLLRTRVTDAVALEGVGSTGSRLLRGERPSFAALEQRFSAFKGAERSLFFSSGYLANLAIATTFADVGDVIFSDERNHASLIDGIRLSRARRVVYPHVDIATLADLMASTQVSGRAFLVTESLFSMDGDVAPLSAYVLLCRAAGATLIVDEAHAVGVCGPRGTGVLETVSTSGVDVISMSTAGKALGVSGAFVSGPGWAIDYLLQRGRPFVFSTAPPPALAAAIDASLDLVEQEPERRVRLSERVAALRAGLVACGLAVPADASHIIPVILGDNARALAVADALQLRGFDVRAIRPPTVAPGTARLRLSVNVNLTDTDISAFTAAFRDVLGTATS